MSNFPVPGTTVNFWDLFTPRLLCCGDGCSNAKCNVEKVLIGASADVVDVPFDVVPFRRRANLYNYTIPVGIQNINGQYTGNYKADGSMLTVNDPYPTDGVPFVPHLLGKLEEDCWPYFTDPDGFQSCRICFNAINAKLGDGNEVWTKLLCWTRGPYCVTTQSYTWNDDGTETASEEILDCCDYSRRNNDSNHQEDGILFEVHPRPYSGGKGISVRRIYFDPFEDEIPVGPDYVPTCGPLESSPP